MIEAFEDRYGGNQPTIHGAKLAAWERLCMSLRVEDKWHHLGFARGCRSLRFSRFERRVGATNLSRIDRMYISDDLGARGNMIEILVGTCMLDHSLVMLVVHDDKRLTPLSMRIPESIQVDEQLGGQIEHLWTWLT